MLKREFWILPLFLILLLTISCFEWHFSGEVVGITEGDTMTVRNSKTVQDVKIRLYGIDTPQGGRMDKLGLWGDLDGIPHLEFGR